MDFYRIYLTKKRSHAMPGKDMNNKNRVYIDTVLIWSSHGRNHRGHILVNCSLNRRQITHQTIRLRTFKPTPSIHLGNQIKARRDLAFFVSSCCSWSNSRRLLSLCWSSSLDSSSSPSISSTSNDESK